MALLVAEAFIGPRPAGMQINHKNCIRTDNRVANLEYVTRRGNMAHAVANGRVRCGSGHWRAKLSEPAVLEIRRRRSNGETGASLAREFGVHESNICLIVKNKGWRHV